MAAIRPAAARAAVTAPLAAAAGLPTAVAAMLCLIAGTALDPHAALAADAAPASFATAPYAAAGASDPPDATPAPGPSTTLMRFPTLHGGQIVFEAHGSLWEVARGGGLARRLTSDAGRDWMPRFSPDGHWIAFTGERAGTTDVYVMPAGGGSARRLTYWSDVMTDAPLRWGPNNLVVTWTPDSRQIVFLSRRKAWNLWDSQLYEVGLDGGLPRRLPLDRGGLLSFSSDGRRIVYNRIFTNFRNWKRYDGGLAQDVYLYDFPTQRLQRLTDWKGTDTAPMWYHDTIYFLSDRDSARRENIWALNLITHALREVTHFTDYDIDFPSLGDDGIVFQQAGWLYVLDLPTEALHRLSVGVPDDGVRTRPRVVDVSHDIRDADNAQQTDYALAPNGQRTLLVARGDVFSVPAAPGGRGGREIRDGGAAGRETRDLTTSAAADEDHPAWSPDGRWVAYTTDASGEQQIAARPAQGGAERLLTHFATGYFYQPLWSADSARLAFSDNEHRLWYLAVGRGAGRPVLVAQDRYQEMHDYSWSPDGQWLAYSLTDAAQQQQIWLYELATRRATRVSEPGSDDFQPHFDAGGHYLFFLSSRHENPVLAENDFEVADVKTTGLYVATLQEDEPSPFAPRSAAVAADHPAALDGQASVGASAPIHIDLKGLMQRAVPVPIPQATLTGFELRGHGLRGGGSGTQIYYQTQPPSTIAAALADEPSDLHRYDLAARADSVLVHDITSFVVSADGTTLLYRRDAGGEPAFYTAPAGSAGSAAGADAAGAQPLDLSHLRMRVDPRQEWEEMFHSAWRLERDFFYRPQMNGVDWVGVRRSYERLLPLAGSRDDLNYLIAEMLGELGNSHTYVAGGDRGGSTSRVPSAYLGVDYGLDARTGRYVFSHVYAGDNTRPEYRSPLTEPGIGVHAGDELVAIDGQPVPIGKSPESYLVGKQHHTVRLTVTESGGARTRDVLVTPLDDELSLRAHAWEDHNRTLVDQASGGRIGYVYLGDTEESGMEAFIRQFYGQLDRQALILDLRWNTGGVADPLVLERLRRVLVGMTTNREGAALTVPQRLLAGPKVCLINEYTVSDGELLAYYFRRYGLGPLIGARSWGGVRFYRGDWSLLDGGYITIPETASYDLHSHWIIENHGVEPDQAVQDSPAELQSGHDAQLQAAVHYLIQALARQPGALPRPPPALPAYAPRSFGGRHVDGNE
jgi:tricorn protease